MRQNIKHSKGQIGKKAYEIFCSEPPQLQSISVGGVSATLVTFSDRI